MDILIKNGRVINPADKVDKLLDVYIKEDRIERVGETISVNAEKIIDAKGCWIVPGLIDVHVHLREPGFEHKETILTGTKSAAAGGFTTICAMPNTNPVVDNEIIVEYIKLKAKREGVVNVLPIGSITKGQMGEELSNIGKMSKVGICAISEDGKSVLNSSVMKTAFKYATQFKLPVLSHCEDKSLAGSGQINAGTTSEFLGLKGISNDSEETIVSRDIILAKSVGARLHLCHLSTAGSVELLRNAKKDYSKISAEVCPHHFTLSDEDITDYDANFKMNPPLRSKKDVQAIKEALADGTIEIIATDHAPHHIDEKNVEFEKAAFGIVGLETAVSLSITELVETGLLTPMQLIEKLTINPAKMLGSDKGTLNEGAIADVTIINPSEEYLVDISKFESKGKNSPFDKRKVKGKVCYTIVNGEIVYTTLGE